MEEGHCTLSLQRKELRECIAMVDWVRDFLLVKDPSRVFLQQTIQMEHHLQVILNYLGF